MNKNVERLYNGIIKENPTFVLMLGMCPTLAVYFLSNRMDLVWDFPQQWYLFYPTC